ncbi:MAG: SRPBCC family protein [Actinomycetota bacterium]|nr:SRPBCC family protein [Actinomycetota bacterium]
MELVHTFTVPASVEDTWAAFMDLEMVAGCFPGATLSSVDGDEFKGSCKVKLGPIALVYSGVGEFVQRDESTHRFVIDAKGKDKRGNGTAGATVTATLAPATLGSTMVEVATDLTITGKPAQFGRGLIQDVSDKLLKQFVTCLESKVGATDASAIPSDVAATTVSSVQPVGTTAAFVQSADTASGEAEAATAGAGHSHAQSQADRPPDPSDEALNLGATVVPLLLKAYGKQAVGVLLGLLALKVLLGRRRKP